VEQVTTNETFDGFPMFSRDGRRIVWASNRNAARPGTRTCSWPTGGSEACARAPVRPRVASPVRRRPNTRPPAEPAQRAADPAGHLERARPGASTGTGRRPPACVRAPRRPRGTSTAPPAAGDRAAARAGRASAAHDTATGRPDLAESRAGTAASPWPRRARARSSRRRAGGRWPARRRAGTGWGCGRAAHVHHAALGPTRGRRRRGTPPWGAGTRGRRRPGSQTWPRRPRPRATAVTRAVTGRRGEARTGGRGRNVVGSGRGRPYNTPRAPPLPSVP
jgi:hypothetical protein